MKKLFLGLLSGFLLTVVALGAAFYFLIMKTDQTPVVLSNTATATSVKTQPTTPTESVEAALERVKKEGGAPTIAFVGTIDLPAALKDKFRPNLPMYVQVHPLGALTKGKIMTIPPMIVPKFPYTFKIPVPSLEVSRWIFESKGLAPVTLTFQYCYKPEVDCRADAPYLMGRTLILVGKPGQEVDVGKFYFSNDLRFGGIDNAPHFPSCGDNSATTGKIIPSEVFLASRKPGQRYAYYMLREPPTLTAPQMARDPSADILAEGFFTPSASGTSFSIPTKSFGKPSFYRGYVAECEPQETLAACRRNVAMSHFFPTNERQTVFGLFAKGLRLPFCSDAGPTELYLHLLPPVPAGAKASGVEAHERNTKIPEEVLEGQFL